MKARVASILQAALSASGLELRQSSGRRATDAEVDTFLDEAGDAIARAMHIDACVGCGNRRDTPHLPCMHCDGFGNPR